MTNLEISHASGLGIRVVKRLSKLTRWDGVTVTVAESFSRACGIDLLRPSEAVDFLRRRKLIYMDQANISQKRMMDRILGQIRC